MDRVSGKSGHNPTIIAQQGVPAAGANDASQPQPVKVLFHRTFRVIDGSFFGADAMKIFE